MNVCCSMQCILGKYGHTVYTGMSIYQYIPVYTAGPRRGGRGFGEGGSGQNDLAPHDLANPTACYIPTRDTMPRDSLGIVSGHDPGAPFPVSGSPVNDITDSPPTPPL